MTDDTSADMDVAVEATIGKGYVIRAWIIIIVCLVLGIWGIFDYAWVIPNQEKYFQRRAISMAVEAVLVQARDNSPEYMTEREKLLEDLKVAIDANRVEPAPTLQEVQASDPASNIAWFATLKVYKAGVSSGVMPSGAPSDPMRQAGKLAERDLALYGDIKEPSVYDRPVQWLFILSLLMVPYYGHILSKHSKRVYALDDKGDLQMPEGTWAADDIADIDMSRWMKKSTAEVIHRDGTRVNLDAYIYKDMNLIIGSIAHGMYPESWEPDGRRIKIEEAPEDDGED